MKIEEGSGEFLGVSRILDRVDFMDEVDVVDESENG